MFSMRFFRVFFVVAVAGALFAIFFGSSLSSASVGQTSPPPSYSEQDINKLVRKFETVKLDVEEAIERVRRGDNLTIIGQSTTFEIELAPHDLRAPEYRAEEAIGGGNVAVVETSSVHTYKGRLRGMKDTEARFTVGGGKIEGVVITPADTYYVQSFRDFETSAAPSDFVLYKGSDVNSDAVGECAVTLDAKIAQASEQFAPSSTEMILAATTLRETDIATEADFEYVQALGGSSGANNEILGILNQVEGVYRDELSIEFRVVYQHTWANSDDPYVSTDASAMLSDIILPKIKTST